MMNFRAVQAIYTFEMSRAARTWMQSIVSPVISTSLYFEVFGAAIGARITEIEGGTEPGLAGGEGRGHDQKLEAARVIAKIKNKRARPLQVAPRWCGGGGREN